MTELSQLTRQRFDYVRLADGRMKAILTVTLPEGRVYRFESTAGANEIGAAVAASSVKTQAQQQDLAAFAAFKKSAAAVRGNHVGAGGVLAPRITYEQAVKVEALRNQLRKKLKSKWRFRPAPMTPVKGSRTGYAYWGATQGVSKGGALKEELYTPGPVSIAAIGTALKEVASARTLLLAAGSLATIIPGAGPVLGPAMMAAASTMGVASKLLDAGSQVAKGNLAGAAKLTAEASSDAARLTKTPGAAQDLLKLANDKRKAVQRIAAGVTSVKPSAPKPAVAKPAPRPAMPAAKAIAHADVLAAARSGRLRSNRAGNISQAALLEAADRGRIFWLA